MRFMMIIKSDEATEAGRMPSQEEMAAMGAYNEELVRAGVLLTGEGLHGTREGGLVRITPESATVTDGPFGNPADLIAGFWLLQVSSRAEAIEWARRVPASEHGDVVVEVRRVFEAEDF